MTKDGMPIAKSTELKEKYKNIGGELVRAVAKHTVGVAGIGTAVTRALRSLLPRAALGTKPVETRRGGWFVLGAFIAELEKSPGWDDP